MARRKGLILLMQPVSNSVIFSISVNVNSNAALYENSVKFQHHPEQSGSHSSTLSDLCILDFSLMLFLR